MQRHFFEASIRFDAAEKEQEERRALVGLRQIDGAPVDAAEDDWDRSRQGTQGAREAVMAALAPARELDLRTPGDHLLAVIATLPMDDSPRIGELLRAVREDEAASPSVRGMAALLEGHLGTRELEPAFRDAFVLVPEHPWTAVLRFELAVREGADTDALDVLVDDLGVSGNRVIARLAQVHALIDEGRIEDALDGTVHALATHRTILEVDDDYRRWLGTWDMEQHLVALGVELLLEHRREAHAWLGARHGPDTIELLRSGAIGCLLRSEDLAAAIALMRAGDRRDTPEEVVLLHELRNDPVRTARAYIVHRVRRCVAFDTRSRTALAGAVGGPLDGPELEPAERVCLSESDPDWPLPHRGVPFHGGFEILAP